MRRTILCIFIGLACLFTAGYGQGRRRAPAALLEGRLYMNVGVVETAGLPNLLGSVPFARGRAHVLQIDRPITEDLRSTVTEAGVVLGDYLPKNAYIVNLDNVLSTELAALDFVRWVGEYEDDWKLDPELGRQSYATPERRALAERGELALTITLFRGRSADSTLKAIAALPGAVVHYTESVGGNETLSATILREDVESLVELNDVQYVEEAPEITLRNSSSRWIVQCNSLDATPLYQNGLRGEGQVVGVLDGEADQDHCSLDGGKILFYNAPDGDDDHGTHVSCTAVGDNGADDDSRGVAYHAAMVFNTTPSFTEAGIVGRLETHHGQGARIHTNSWGDDGTTSYNGLSRGFDSFLYDNEDDFVALAASNQTTLRNPENAKNLLAVGASQDTPSQSFFCSGGVGPTDDGRRKPEIFAPGCGTVSAIPSPCSVDAKTGTSMATPAVAGAAALVRQYYVDGYYPSGTANAPDSFIPSGALIKATLLNSAVDMTGISGYPSDQEGWGRLLADRTLFFPGDPRDLGLVDVRNASGLATGEVDQYTVTLGGSGQALRVTLVYTDPPASASTGSGFAAVNDLDLEVVDPGATTYLGNVFGLGESVSGGSKDDRNNVEQVQIHVPDSGSWTLRVVGASVNVGTQGYALVVSGPIGSATGGECGNGVADPGESCDPGAGECPAECDCCNAYEGLGCSDPVCEAAVCGLDPFCCSTEWDDVCAGLALDQPECQACCTPPPSDCCEVHGATGCSDTTCKDLVCFFDGFCCGTQWDSVCVEEALQFPQCVACCPPEDCRGDCTYCGDGVVDAPIEDCDDGNNDDGDGCSALCTYECTAIFDETILATDPTTFSWSGASDVDWVRGELAQVGTYGVDELGSAAAATSIPAPQSPAAGEGLYWVVRFDCPIASWSSGGPGECSPAEICPPGGRDGNLPLP